MLSQALCYCQYYSIAGYRWIDNFQNGGKAGKKMRGRSRLSPLRGDKVFEPCVRIYNKQESDIRMSLKRLS